MIGEFLRRLGYYFRRRSLDADLAEEMRYHAALAGRKQFGNVTQLEEESRAMWTWTWIEQLAQDLRYAVRSMRASKAFTSLAVLSLALGIGANTALFSYLEAILLRSLPVRDPQALVVLGWHSKDRPAVVRAGSWSTYTDPGIGFNTGSFPYPAFDLLRANNSVFESLFGFRRIPSLNMLARGQANLVSANYVTGDYFHSLGASSAAGRLLGPDDDAPGAAPAIVISYPLWQSRFGGSADVIGESISVNRQPFTIAGVTPAGFFGVIPGQMPDVFMPMHAMDVVSESTSSMSGSGKYTDAKFYWIELMARLRPGVSRQQAEAALAPMFHQWVESTAVNDQERADLPILMLREGGAGIDVLRRRYEQPLLLLQILAGLILAIACANLANLLLTRATARRREMAVRLSVGAGRWRVIFQLLTESVLLSAAGGVLGIAVAYSGVQFLRAMLVSGSADLVLDAGLNWRVLAATAGLSLLTGLLFGLAPAIQATRVDVIPALKETRAGERRTRRSYFPVTLSQILVVSQIALALLIVAAAGLFARTLSNYNAVELGFNGDNVLLFMVNGRQAGYSNDPNGQSPSLDRLYDRLREQLAAIPGVASVTSSDTALVSGSRSNTGFRIGDSDRRAERTNVLAVGPGFFSTMQIPLLAGRDIGATDTSTAPGVAVVNESFAKTYFPGEEAVGKTIYRGGNALQIVGVSRNARYNQLRGPIEPMVYTAYRQNLAGMVVMFYALRTSGDPLAYVSAARQALQALDASVPMSSIRTQAAQIEQTFSQTTTFARLSAAFAALALAIACVGLYGTVSYGVARRTNEIGIRMALGAQCAGVVWMVLRQMAVMVAAGLLIGIPIAYSASDLVKAFVFEMQPNDPATLAAAVAILAAAAIAASYIPARRASRIDPMVALRHE